MIRFPSLSAPLGTVLTVLALSSAPLAQQEAPPTTWVSVDQDSGWVSNDGPTRAVVASFTVAATGAEWMRLYFETVELAGDPLSGDGAILRITSHEDGAVQELDAIHVAQWQSSSAYFNGDAVQVEIVAAPHTGPSRVELRAADLGLVPAFTESQCFDTDDRVLSNDPRSARILPIGCTGWLIDDCKNCFLTAGHCTGGTSTVQFDVPLSNANGSLNQPPPEDQYAVDPSSLQSNGGQGVGNDWGYFGTFPNTNTGLTAAQAQGSVFTLANPPASPAGQTIRITGYGVDSTPSTHNQVQQTHAGPMVTSTTTTVQYQTDTEGGNSGSPVIWEDTGLAVGIHTHGGCGLNGGANSGTASTNPGLASVLADPRGVCAAGFDFPNGLTNVFSATAPTTLTVDVQGAIVPGSVELHYRYDGGPFLSQAMTLVAGQQYESTLPPPACGQTPEYYFSFTDADCGPVLDPAAGPNGPYGALVGDLVTVFADDFETDTGWTVANVGATTGDWERGVPVNDPNWAYDPMSDSDGSGSSYLTMNQLGNTDVDDGQVELVSPSFDLTGPPRIIEYDYFLRLTDEDGTDRMLVQVSPNGAAGPWTEVARHDTDGGLAWRSHTITTSDVTAAGVTPTSDMRLRFRTNDGNPQSINESGLDAFRISLIDCDGAVGTNYCQSGVSGAQIAASGTTSVTLNDLVLAANGVPPFANGVFVYGGSQQQMPFGQGFLCIQTPVFRLGPVTNSGAQGQLMHMLDVTNPPNPLGTIGPGSTWNFQGWFRLGGTFDLTDGLSVTFTP